MASLTVIEGGRSKNKWSGEEEEENRKLDHAITLKAVDDRRKTKKKTRFQTNC